jgi:hypothetical protein
MEKGQTIWINDFRGVRSVQFEAEYDEQILLLCNGKAELVEAVKAYPTEWDCCAAAAAAEQDKAASAFEAARRLLTRATETKADAEKAAEARAAEMMKAPTNSACEVGE